jgi:flagellar assembly protein FliH
LSSNPQRVRVLHSGSDAAARPARALGLDLDQVDVQSFDPARVEAAIAEGHRQGLLQGTREGFATGYGDGQAAAAAEIADLKRHLQSLLVTMRDQLGELGKIEATLLAQLEGAIVDTGFQLAGAILVNEVRTSANPGAEALARALKLAPTGAAAATAHLHPDDVDHLGDITHLALGTRLTIVANPDIEYGGCLLEVGECIIDAQLGPALLRARDAMLSDFAAVPAEAAGAGEAGRMGGS